MTEKQAPLLYYDTVSEAGMCWETTGEWRCDPGFGHQRGRWCAMMPIYW